MSDAADDAGQEVRRAIAQALQTALMVSQYQRGLRSEQRAAAEHRERAARAKRSEAREREIHDLKKQGYLERAGKADAVHELDVQERLGRMARSDADLERRDRLAAAGEARDAEIHQLKKQGYTDRAANTAALHDLDQQERLGRIARADTDLQRRDRVAAAQQVREAEVHKLKRQGYANREQRAGELHQLDKRERLQRMAIRARAAGFSERLATVDADTGRLAESIAGFAAAAANADLGPDQRRAADAYRERVRDAGIDPDDLIATARSQHAAEPLTDATVAGFDAGPGMDAAADPILERIEELTGAALDAADTVDDTTSAAAVDGGAAIAELIHQAGLDRVAPNLQQSVSVTTPAADAGFGYGTEEGLQR